MDELFYFRVCLGMVVFVALVGAVPSSLVDNLRPVAKGFAVGCRVLALGVVFPALCFVSAKYLDPISVVGLVPMAIGSWFASDSWAEALRSTFRQVGSEKVGER